MHFYQFPKAVITEVTNRAIKRTNQEHIALYPIDSVAGVPN